MGRASRKADVVAITALPLEFQAVKEYLTGCEEVVHEHGTIYDVGKLGPALTVAIAEVGAGNANAAAETERAIQYFNPQVALFVGVAGGIKDVRLGDVVAATEVYGYEGGKVAKTYLPRGSVCKSSYKLVQRARAEARSNNWLTWVDIAGEERAPKALVAPIAAGEKVVANVRSAVFDFIKQQYSAAVAVEMEGLGFLTAGHANEVECLVVRGISDLVDDKHKADSLGWQPRAASHAAAFAMSVVQVFLTESRGAARPMPKRSSVAPRVRKTFSDVQRKRFLQQSFAELTTTLRGLADKLIEANPEVECDIRQVDANNVELFVYVDGAERVHARYWIGDKTSTFANAICFGEGAGTGMNEYVQVEDDGYALVFTASNWSAYPGIAAQGTLSFKEAAEYLWRRAIASLTQ